jgi:hypothetical protein
MRTTSPLILLVLAVGCASEPPDTVVYAPVCPQSVCGLNSPEVARNGMHEANLFGEPDENKISLETGSNKGRTERARAQIWDAQGHSYDLHVENDRLFGVDPDTGVVLKSDGLIGAELHVLQSGQPIYHIRIDGVRMLTMPIGPSDLVELYTMIWVPQGSTEEGELCGVPDRPFDDIKDQDQLWGMHAGETLIILGDRFNAEAKTMNQNEDWNPSWFNFGCAGRTIAKMKLLRKTQKSGTGNWKTRQAALKMLAADYCGTGKAFTRTGTRVEFKDTEYVPDYPWTPTVIEARWNERGATCVSTPRRQSAVPYVFDYIYATCLPIDCYENDLWNPTITDLDGALIVSALYQ